MSVTADVHAHLIPIIIYIPMKIVETKEKYNTIIKIESYLWLFIFICYSPASNTNKRMNSMSADLFDDIHSLVSVDEDIIHIPISSTIFTDASTSSYTGFLMTGVPSRSKMYGTPATSKIHAAVH